MAFNFFPYGGYQPAVFYPQPTPDQMPQLRQQPTPQPTVQQTAPMQQNSGMIWVNGKAEADGYLIAPGCAVALWDSNAPVVYLRQADSTGKPSTKVFDLIERVDTPQVAPQIDTSKFVTMEQLDEILAERFKKPAKVAAKKEDTDNG